MSSLTLEQYAQTFNLTCVCFVLVVSLWVHRSHSSAFFRQWLIAYGFGTLMLMMDLPSAMLGRPAVVCVVQVLLCVASFWHFVQAGLRLKDKVWPSKHLGAALGIAGVASTAGLLAGASFNVVSALPLLLWSGSVVWLGITFFQVVGRTRGGRLAWLGGTFVANGLIPFAYPFVLGTPYFVLGLWVAGVAQLGVGFGMVFFLLDEAIGRVREENARLVEQEQARANFLSTVSHELRTPLTSIMGNLEFLEDGLGGDLSPQQAAFTDEMRQSSEHLAALIETLLDSSQINAGALSVRMQCVDLAGCLRAAVSTMGAIAEKGGVALHLEMPDRLPLALGDGQRILQVLINLIGNAVKFTPRGGNVVVTTGLRESMVFVAVTDTGIGIPPERQEKIFEPFYQVDNSLTREHSGSGLGLWIVKNLITAMGGQITVESQVEEGSTFRFTLSIAPEQVPLPPEGSAWQTSYSSMR